MEISKVTIHQIKKEQGISYTELFESSILLDVNENVQNLIEKLNEAFAKDEKVIKSEFLEEVNVFQRTLKGYNESEDENNNDQFLNFTRDSIGRIRDLLTGATLATGGYFVFSEYLYRTRRYVSVFLVRDSEELIFNRSAEGNYFVVDKTTIINTSKLAMAVRVDLARLTDGADRYLHFTHKQADISDYFITWIEVQISDKSREDTVALVNLINNIDPLPIDPATNSPYEAEKFRNKIYDHIQSVGRVVKISELSNSFWGNRDFLSNHIEENDININQEFRAAPSVLTRLKKYTVNAGSIKLSFSKSDISSGRVFKGDGDQVVIESPQFRGKFEHLDE